ncbi:MAG: protein kinase [Acidobacteriota bacterium]
MDVLRPEDSFPALPSASQDSTQTILGPGSQARPYRIEAAIGSGGMGQVFLAFDTRLNRRVALKISHQPFDPRFEREARAIAQLNHPHICTLYDVGPNFLVMELVEGETLAARLKRGPLPQDKAMLYGAQIADALAAAHGKGITHRDLKPANVMVTKAGVKVLDFGLAKMTTDETLTMANAVMGTPAYMAPEQREGKSCDARADIYSLGLILREMATGKRSADTGTLPAIFGHVVARCLEEDPTDRWQSAADLRRELEWSAAAALPAATGAPSSRVPWIVAAIACASLLIAVAAVLRQKNVPEFGASQFEISLGEVSGEPILSPDGRMIAFERSDPGGASIWVRSLESIEARKLPETVGAANPIWSPDGKWLAFWAGGKLRKVSPAGGPGQVIAEIPGFQDGAWSPSGEIVFRTNNRTPLFRIKDSGGVLQPLTTLNSAQTENSHRHPEFLPDGRHFLFVSRCSDRANNALYLASLDSPDLRRLMPAQAQVRFVPARDGQPNLLFFYCDGALVAQPFDPEKGTIYGDAKTVVDKIGYNPPSIQASFGVSRDGRMVMTRTAGASDTRFVWYRRNGEEAGTLGATGLRDQPRLSPHQDFVLFTQADPQTGNRDVYSMEVARGIPSRLTTNAANDWEASWAADGRRILFASDRQGGSALQPYIKASLDPSSPETHIPGIGTDVGDLSPDGKWIVGGNRDLEIAPVSSGTEPFKFLATPASERDARFSPDGKWLAYVSNVSGTYNVYVRPFAGGPALAENAIQISPNGGEFIVWGSHGEEIFYMTADGSIVSVDTRRLGQTPFVPPPTTLFRACPETRPEGLPGTGVPYWSAFDTRDGQRFLVNCLAQPAGHFTVLLHWMYPR